MHAASPRPAASNVPRHVGIIMDGNGRWARRRLLPRIEGHRAGARSVRRIMEASVAMGIRYLSLYTFSLENWDRPAEEVNELMRMLRLHLLKERSTMLEQGIRLRAVGERRLLPAEVRETLLSLEEETLGGRALDLVLALSYGGRQEIDQAARELRGEALAGRLDPGAITEERFTARLQTGELPPVDLLIRTSGECRLSNFLLWSTVGAYFHVTGTFWPSFGKRELEAAVAAWRRALPQVAGAAS